MNVTLGWVTKPPAALDTVVFDMDGVLVDVRESFRLVICEIVQRYLQVRAPQLATGPAPVAPSDLQPFKRAGGFNDDVDLACAIVGLWLGARGRPDLGAAAAAAAAGGGGLGALGGRFPVALPDRDEMEVMFKECYWGPTRYEQVFALAPKHGFGDPGLISRERALASPDLLDRLRAAGVVRFGVVTGRIRPEVESGLEILGWTGLIPPDAIISSEELRKPDPECLRRVAVRLGSRSLMYVGDTQDDLSLVLNYRATAGALPAVFTLVGDETERIVYRTRGADLLVDSAGEIVNHLAPVPGAAL
ncbi:MAG: HAD family hydrolase [Candidatus Dormibacteria bacterium]